VLAKSVWGDAYIETMLSLNIPSLLSRRNIGSLAGYDVEHRLYTTEADREKIEAAPIYRHLATQVPCSIVTPNREDLVDAGAAYEGTIARMNAYHHAIIDDCAAIGATWMFDQPDHIWGDGSLLHLVNLAANGDDIVFFPSMSGNLEELIGGVAPWRNTETGAIDVPNRALVDLAFKHMQFHDLTRFWGTPVSTEWPHHIAFRVAPDCVMRRCFYPQPYLIKTAGRPRLIRSVDFSYIETARENGESFHFIGDSDDFFILEASRKYQFPDYNVKKMSMGLIGNWAIRYAEAGHIEAFSHPVVYHTGEIPHRQLARINRFADAVTSGIVSMVEIDRALAALVDPHPRATAFIRLCMNRDEILRRVRVKPPFTLRLPAEASVPDLAIFGRRLSVEDLDRIVSWIEALFEPAASGVASIDRVEP